MHRTQTPNFRVLRAHDREVMVREGPYETRKSRSYIELSHSITLLAFEKVKEQGHLHQSSISQRTKTIFFDISQTLEPSRVA